MSNVHSLNYRSDQRKAQFVIMGPDLFGGLWQVVYSEYDEETDMTRVTVIPYFERRAISEAN